MKTKALYAALVLITLATVVLVWRFFSPADPSGLDGFPIVCPNCDHLFTLDEEELYTHPKSPTGEGFKCPECEKFGARIAAKCDKCGAWAIMQQLPDGTTVCPKCPKPPGAAGQ